MIELIGWIATAGTLLSFAVKEMWVINASVILMHLYWFYTNRKGLGIGGESLKENFIDSNSVSQSVSNEVGDIDFMYNWIRKHSKK